MTYEEVKQDYDLSLNILKEDSRLLSVWIAQVNQGTYEYSNDVTPRELQRIADDLDNAYSLIRFFEANREYFIWEDTLKSYTDEVRVKYSEWLNALQTKGYTTTSHVLGEMLSDMLNIITPRFDKKDDWLSLIIICAFFGIALFSGFGVVLFGGDNR